MLASRSSGLASSPDGVIVLCSSAKILYSLSASLHSGVQLGTGEFNPECTPAMDWYPIQGGVEILLGPVVQKLDNPIHRINRYPVDKY